MAKLIVNMNGTPKEDLAQTRVDAMNAIRAAAEALTKAGPHPRDFPNGDFPEAQAKHFKRMEALRTMLTELEEEAVQIMDEGSCEIVL